MIPSDARQARKARRLARKRHDGGADPLSLAVAGRDRNVMEMVRAALEHNQVMLAYQPVMQATRPGQPAFYEGLIRVLDETGRIIPARDFITEIESTELGRIVDCLALQLGLDALARTPDLRLSINMSARSIGYKRWMRTLTKGLDAHPTVAERLILEITEGSAMTVPELVIDFMDDLKLRGISFAMDDFGAGQTALRYFKDFNFDVLKIDGAFTRNIHTDSDNQVLVKALILIARQFDMFVVAENVERQAEADYLASIGADCLQGYLFGAPSIVPPWEQTEERRKTA